MQLSTPHFLHSLSSLARYFGKALPGFSFELIEGSIVDIAKVYDDIRYPGVDGIDAVVYDGDLEAVFYCVDSVAALRSHPLSVMNLLYDKSRDVYLDRTGCYRELRRLELNLQPGSAPLTMTTLLEAAALVSCFGFKPSSALLDALDTLADLPAAQPEPMTQRLYLSAVVGGEHPAAGLKLLMDYASN